MNQGFCSFVEKRNNRLYKKIHSYDEYGPFEECKLLKYVSQLGPEFPQHVKCEGLYKLSYDYIDGVTLKEYMNYNPNYNQKVNIFIQLIKINKKLINVGIYLCDQVLENFILDLDGIVHMIDFGYVHNPHRKQISVVSDEHEPSEEYENVLCEPDVTCLMKSLYTWYKNGLLDEQLLDIASLNIDDLDKLVSLL